LDGRPSLIMYLTTAITYTEVAFTEAVVSKAHGVYSLLPVDRDGCVR